MSNIVSEICSDCGNEVELFWNIETDGYRFYCPYCGEENMFCSECE